MSAVATVILVSSAVVLTVQNVRHAYFLPPAQPREFVADWRTYAETGQRMGPQNAKVVVVVFNDYECPVCRRLPATLAEVRHANPESVAVVIRHFPLPGHALARAAAHASICAERFGRFNTMYQMLLSEGTLSSDPQWSDVASRAGIRQVGQFTKCMRESRTDSVLVADMADAIRVGAPGTPTLLVNGEKYFGIPFRLDDIVERHLNAAPAR